MNTRPIILNELDEARFWAKVARPNKNGCALWLACTDQYGYGRFTVGPKVARLYHRAHRVAHTIATGPIPDGMDVDHMCHTPACVAPLHLRAATRSQNCQNRAGAYSTSKTGIRGVSWCTAVGMWQATATVNREQNHLGYFHDIADAESAVVEFRRAHMPFSVFDVEVPA